MTDETIVGDDEVTEVVTPDDDATEAGKATETEDQDTEAEASETDTEDEPVDGDETDEEEPEEIEFNFNGDKLRVPKGSLPEELATKVDQFVRNAEAATTRKMQDIAGKAKALDAREQAVEKLVSLQGEALNTYSRGLSLRADIDRLTQIVQDRNVPADQAQRAMFELQRKQIEFNNVVNDVSNAESQMSQAIAEDRERRTTEGKAVLERQIKDFDKAKSDLFAYVEANTTIPREVIERDYAINPELTVFAHKAMMFDRLQAQTKAKTAKPKPTAPNPVSPPKGKGGRSAFDPVRDADKMSADEWVRRERARLARKKQQGA